MEFILGCNGSWQGGDAVACCWKEYYRLDLITVEGESLQFENLSLVELGRLIGHFSYYGARILDSEYIIPGSLTPPQKPGVDTTVEIDESDKGVAYKITQTYYVSDTDLGPIKGWSIL